MRTPGSPSSKFLKVGDPTSPSPVSLIAVIREHLITRRGPSRGFYETHLKYHPLIARFIHCY